MDPLRPIFKPSVSRRKRTGKSGKTLGKYYPHYFGRWKPAGRGWTWVKLYTDKSVSDAAWRQFRKEHEQAAVHGLDERSARLRKHTLAELIDLYLLDLTAQRRSAEHIEITGRMLRQLVAGTGWKLYRDIRVSDVQQFLNRPEHGRWTVAYQVDWVKKARAFANWLRPKGQPHPLEDLRRPSRRNAIRRKGRRVAKPAELQALLSDTLPPQRRLAYALAALNGLRRGEATKLTWGNVLLEANPPQLRLAPKDSDAQREFDQVPLHPFVEKLLRSTKRGDASPTARVLLAVPEAKTVRRDLERAGFSYADDRGQLLCYHALRHTYKHNLERAGTPHTPVRQLMRHCARSVTDTYGASDMEEMYRYLKRLDPTGAETRPGAAVVEQPGRGADEVPLQEQLGQIARTTGGDDAPPLDPARPREVLRWLLDAVGGAEGLQRELQAIGGSAESAQPPGIAETDHAAAPGEQSEVGDLSPYLSPTFGLDGRNRSQADPDEVELKRWVDLLLRVAEIRICRSLSPPDLKGPATDSTVQNSRPDTQAD